MERWDDVRVFLAVTREGSFTSAARSLEVEQSTVSRRIAKLEESLGAPLFERTPGGLRPTALASRLTERAETVEALVHGFVDEAAAEERGASGRVRIAVTEELARYVLVPRVLPALRESHPDLRPELLVGYGATDLLQREADVALRFFRPPSTSLAVARVATLSTAVIAHRAYLRSRPARARTAQGLDWIGLTLRGDGMPEASWQTRHVPVAPCISTDSYATQIDMVRAGLGVALLTRSVMLADPELVELDLGLPRGPRLSLYLVTHRSIEGLPRVTAVLRALRTAVSAIDDAAGAARGARRASRRGRRPQA